MSTIEQPTRRVAIRELRRTAAGNECCRVIKMFQGDPEALEQVVMIQDTGTFRISYYTESDLLVQFPILVSSH